MILPRLCLTAPAASPCHANCPMPDIVTREHWITTAQGRLYARQWEPASGHPESDAPILLLHDSLGSVALWRDFPEHLATASGRRVLAYDRLGFGRSDAHPGALGLDFIRAEAIQGFQQVREALGIGDFIVFGHSVGGGMAVACAARFPDQCKALITESAQAFVEDRTLAGIRAAQQAFADPVQRGRLARYHGDKTDWVLSAWIDTWLSPPFADWNLDAELARVRCPVLALHGDQDEYGSVEHPRRIARLAGGDATAELLAGRGHVPHREAPEETLARVTRWLDAHLTRPAG